MARNWNRAYRLVAGVAGTGFEIGSATESGRAIHIKFDLEKTDVTSNNTGTISIWNLNDQHVSILEQKDCMSRLKRCILELPAEEREMLELFYFSKIKAQDIGTLYHISTKTVYNRLHAITNKLQQRMKGEEQID